MNIGFLIEIIMNAYLAIELNILEENVNLNV